MLSVMAYIVAGIASGVAFSYALAKWREIIDELEELELEIEASQEYELKLREEHTEEKRDLLKEIEALKVESERLRKEIEHAAEKERERVNLDKGMSLCYDGKLRDNEAAEAFDNDLFSGSGPDTPWSGATTRMA